MQALSKLLFVPMFLVVAATARGQITVPPQVYSSGAAAIAAGQTARWSVANPPQQTPPSEECSATLAFINEANAVLKTETVTVRAGEIRFLELKDSDAPATGNRIVFHAHALVPVAAGRPCGVIPTLEIFDNATGKTSVFATGTLLRPTNIFFPL
jgi:hypothetical protein